MNKKSYLPPVYEVDKFTVQYVLTTSGDMEIPDTDIGNIEF